MSGLLSIDWDYFISMKNMPIESMLENKKTINDWWYKRFLQGKSRGEDLYKHYQLSKEVYQFWEQVEEYFEIDDDIKVYVSESHRLSYDLAKTFNCHEVYLFDAHSDLGYGGLSSLEFEVNCANWLGHLLKDHQINQAHILYSPYTKEKPEWFNQINHQFNVEYLSSWKQLKNKSKISVIHICRSGAWTPPWFDDKFFQFIRKLKMPYKIIDCPKRQWKINNLTYAEQLQYLMS